MAVRAGHRQPHTGGLQRLDGRSRLEDAVGLFGLWPLAGGCFRVGGGLDIFRATLYNRVQYEGVIFSLGKSRLFLFNFFSLKGEFHEHTDQPVP